MAEVSVTLCCVAGGDVYVRYARALEESARAHFLPGTRNYFKFIPGQEGWPDGTMYRWHRLLENMPDTDYVFLCDADMYFENPVGPEILSRHITVTTHPGFVGKAAQELPYERRPASCCCVVPEDGAVYFAGGFAGGPTEEVKRFAGEIAARIDQDVANGIVPVWHDESALNKVASEWTELHVLDPSMCHPDQDEYYIEHIWPRRYERKLVALDKAEWERVGRIPPRSRRRRLLEATIGYAATERLRHFLAWSRVG